MSSLSTSPSSTGVEGGGEGGGRGGTKRAASAAASSSSTSSTSSSLRFEREKHVRYFCSCLKHLPAPYVSLDTNRMTLVHFAVHALDMLGALDDDDLLRRLEIDKKRIVEWMYDLQIGGGGGGGEKKDDGDGNVTKAGFLGGTFLGGGRCHDDDDDDSCCVTRDDNTALERKKTTTAAAAANPYTFGHIAMTYTAICTLVTLGDDLSRLDRVGIVKGLASLQGHDGSYQCVAFGSENDMRFLYCACAISCMLDDWSGVDIERGVEFVRGCRCYDGGISLIPGQEGHGGSTFCGVAALALMNRLDVLEERGWRSQLVHWCVHRQVGGMQGRPNKAEDTCYSFWIGGTLDLLNRDRLLDHENLRDYVLSCQSSQLGGFGKVVSAFPDILHSFYSLAWLSLSSKYFPTDQDQYRLKQLNCTLGICQERADVFGVHHP